MDFTPEQEQVLIEQNMPKIYRAVDNYAARHSSTMASVPYEDFVQEVALAFLQYIRKCETQEEVNRFPWFSAMDAMRNLVRVYQPMSCSSDPRSFSDVIHNMPVTMSLDDIQAKTGIEIDGMSKHWVEDKETQIDFDDFMSGQTESVQRVASMRIYGMTLREIGNQYGVQKGTVCKWLDKLNNAYKEYMEGAKNAE
jgi:RNA polymerase sigma factor (sigma-70 family)